MEWRKDGEWIDREDLVWDSTLAPQAHLPLFVVTTMGYMWIVGNGGLGFGEIMDGVLGFLLSHPDL